MNKGSDFVYAYLKSLNSKEMAKLKCLLYIDERHSELRLVEIAEQLNSVDEKVIQKKSKYTRKSYFKVKSDLKTYLLETSGYQDRVYNQQLLERISIAQGLLRRRFVKEGYKILDDLSELATRLGANQYAIVALSLKTWSILFNQQERFTSIQTVFKEMEERMKVDSIEMPYMVFTMQVLDLAIHDPGLRYGDSKQTLQDLISSPILKSDLSQLSLFNQWMMMAARWGLCILTRQFPEAMQMVATIITTRHGYPPYRPSEELVYLFEQLCIASMLSKEKIQIEKNVELFYGYVPLSFPKNETFLMKAHLYKCWECISNNEFDTAELYLSKFNVHLARSAGSMTERQQFDCISQAILLSLNLGGQCKTDLIKTVNSLHFKPEWNEPLNTAFNILVMFNSFHQAVTIKNKAFSVKDDSLYSQSKRLKDVFRKRSKTDEFEFEIALCNLFMKFRVGIEAKSIVKYLRKFDSNYNQLRSSQTYVMRYHDYFNFSKWVNELIENLLIAST